MDGSTDRKARASREKRSSHARHMSRGPYVGIQDVSYLPLMAASVIRAEDKRARNKIQTGSTGLPYPLLPLGLSEEETLRPLRNASRLRNYDLLSHRDDTSGNSRTEREEKFMSVQFPLNTARSSWHTDQNFFVRRSFRAQTFSHAFT